MMDFGFCHMDCMDGMRQLRDFYKVLQRYGFSFRSMEEIKILNGTHECYVKEKENADETE